MLCGTAFSKYESVLLNLLNFKILLTTTKQHGYADKNCIDLLITTFSRAGGGRSKTVL